MKPAPTVRLIWNSLVLAGTMGILPAAAARSGSRAEVIVNVSMTAEGRKVPPPTPEHPTYFIPVVPGWREDGNIVAGEQPPPRAELLRIMQRELAKQGYLFVPDIRMKPSLILAFEWGYMNPVVADSGGTSIEEKQANPDITFNAREMRQLVLGDGRVQGGMLPPSVADRLDEAAGEDRYFVIVTAFDLAAAQKHERKILWRARMSTSRQGVSLEEVMGRLIVSGAPLFGRETAVPQILTGPIAPEGRVKLGELEVIESDVSLKDHALEAKPGK